MTAPPVGEVAALATSICWTFSSLAFALAARRIGALALNQVRIVLAVLVLLVLHALVLGQAWPAGASRCQLGWLALSGIVGLALGDLCYFHCIGLLGPRLGTLLMATAPVQCALLAEPVLGESLDGWAALGIALTVAGVLVVLADPRGGRTWNREATPAARRVALLCGVLAALGQAGGMVLAKLGMRDGSGEPLPALSATVVRMTAGAAGVILIALCQRRLVASFRALDDGRSMAATALGVTFGPTLGVWLSLVALSHTQAGIASALMSLQPVLMLPVARFAYGARPGRLAVVGTLAAVAGVAVLGVAGPH